VTMRFRPTNVACLTLFLAPATPSFAGDVPECGGERWWDQLDVAGLSVRMSQDRGEGSECVPGWVESADDFLGADRFVTSVSWRGQFVGTYREPESFRIRVYARNEGGGPGELLHEVERSDYVEQRDIPRANYCVSLDPPFFAEADVTYYLSIQAVVCGPDMGVRAGDRTGEVFWMRDSFDLVWVQGGPSGKSLVELAFALFEDENAVPVQSSTWSRIKTQYGSETTGSR